jgi:diguanylate cyclase (GGDEF)-like protein
MKILVLENSAKEFELIQQALDNSKDTLVPLYSSEQIWPYTQSGEASFVIANWDTSDLRVTQFIQRVRAAKLVEPLYIIVTTGKNSVDDLASIGADDVVQRPFKSSELKNRVAMAERIISLASNLAVARDQLKNQALFDPLTGFMNRAALLKQSGGELERARRAAMPVSFVALDIDDFKMIRDKFGSELGKEVLKVVAQSIREKSRPYDSIGRWTGGVFVLMLAGAIGADAEKVAERIIAGVRGTRIEVENETPLNVKISVGIASVARIGVSTEVEPMIHQALQAMERARQEGGNQIFLIYV